jgi:hypothetical protein
MKRRGHRSGVGNDGPLQRLAAALNYRALRLHKSLLPNRQVETVDQGMKKSEATYLFMVSISSVKRYVRDGPFRR